MKENIAISGGTGFIGSHLATRLAKDGYYLKCLVRKESSIAHLRELGVELIYGDIMEKETLNDFVQQAGVIFHLAGQVSVSQSISHPLSTCLTNIVGTLNLLEALRANRLADCLVIYLSTDRVYGNPTSQLVSENTLPMPFEPYGASKLCAEHLYQAYSRAYSIPFIILRGANVYGPGQDDRLFIPSIIKQIFFTESSLNVGNLGANRNFVYVEDMVEALYLALVQRDRARNQVFNIGESGAKLQEILDFLLELSLKYLSKTFQIVQEPSLVRPLELESDKYVLDCSKARRVLGWSPEFTLKQGLMATFERFVESARENS